MSNFTIPVKGRQALVGYERLRLLQTLEFSILLEENVMFNMLKEGPNQPASILLSGLCYFSDA